MKSNTSCLLTSLKYFLEADKKLTTTFTSPHLYDLRHRFWLNNKLQLAQVCMRMGKNEEAKNHLLSALDIAEVTEEDKVSMKQVKKHLDYYKWWPVDGEEEKK